MPSTTETPAPYRIVTFKADDVKDRVLTALMGYIFPSDPAKVQAAAAAIESLYHAANYSTEWIDPTKPLPPVEVVIL